MSTITSKDFSNDRNINILDPSKHKNADNFRVQRKGDVVIIIYFNGF